jgi:hypothetical protein
MKGYQELSNVVVATGLASGIKSWSDWLDGYTWGRKMIVRVTASSPYDIIIQRRGADGQPGQEIPVNSVNDVPVGGGMFETDYDFAMGRSFRIAVRNAGEEMTDYQLSLVLLG